MIFYLFHSQNNSRNVELRAERTMIQKYMSISMIISHFFFLYSKASLLRHSWSFQLLTGADDYDLFWILQSRLSKLGQVLFKLKIRFPKTDKIIKISNIQNYRTLHKYSFRIFFFLIQLSGWVKTMPIQEQVYDDHIHILQH